MAPKIDSIEIELFFPFLEGGHQIPMIDAVRVFASHGAKSTILTTPSNSLLFHNSIMRIHRGGHQIPMIDATRVFASHGAKSTILATPFNSLHFQNSISRDQKTSLPVPIHTFSTYIPDANMPTVSPFIYSSALLEPHRHLVILHPPNCIIVDMFHCRAHEISDKLGIMSIVLNGHECFPCCITENIRNHVMLENLSSNSEPFVVLNIPHRIEITRNPSQFPDRMNHFDNSLNIVTNNFYDLELDYADYVKKGKKTFVGPVSLCNKSTVDKSITGRPLIINEQKCLNWLTSKKPNSVLYVSFGSIARLPPEHLKEISYGLEASEQSFIWVLFILEHVTIKGFMTHCGWNSYLESLCAGMPMIAWPISVEQFLNEKLITEVLKIGVQVGSREWLSWNSK
ncbi:Abscisate beta-glucosyltransferase [Glycine soja]|uniref:Abscisate beta-glucosyltransferase n=1 Tax=Glycine soja TaxID=3848 RepID=A0A445LM40_GLYSO|nr:Abscisate beta-glucosyltransferase [Glycine soja]